MAKGGSKINERHLVEGEHKIINDYISKTPIFFDVSEKTFRLPQKGCIPNHYVAIKIAEAIWLPIYGEKIYNEQPFNTTLLKDSVWIVTGTLPKNEIGGTVYLKIRKKDGLVLCVTHNK